MTKVQEAPVRRLATMIRDARGDLSQEYVALRLGRTKGWLSKVENDRLGMDAGTLRRFGALVGWSEQQTQEALELLGPKDSDDGRKKTQLLEVIHEQLQTLRQLVEGRDMAQVLYETYAGMNPDPTLPFLLFVSDSLEQAITHERDHHKEQKPNSNTEKGMQITQQQA